MENQTYGGFVNHSDSGEVESTFGRNHFRLQLRPLEAAEPIITLMLPGED